MSRELPALSLTSAEMIARSVEALRGLADELASFPPVDPVSGDRDAVQIARRLLSERRRRDATLPAGLFGEPAWGLMLSLFIAQRTGAALAQSVAIKHAEFVGAKSA